MGRRCFPTVAHGIPVSRQYPAGLLAHHPVHSILVFVTHSGVKTSGNSPTPKLVPILANRRRSYFCRHFRVSGGNGGSMIFRIKICSAKILCVSLFAFLLSPIAFGQGGVSTGDLRVTVKDPSGNVVTNAAVNVVDVNKGVERTATADG